MRNIEPLSEEKKPYNIAPFSAETKRSLQATSSPPPSTTVQRTPWHSPVPYLFGGLAAMLGLIAFALLILACSYWKLSARQLDDDHHQERESRERDLESGDGEKEGESEGKSVKVYEEKILVIMAGDENPTFLATPVSVKVSSFGDGSDQMKEKEKEKEMENCVNLMKDTETHQAQEQNQ